MKTSVLALIALFGFVGCKGDGNPNREVDSAVRKYASTPENDQQLKLFAEADPKQFANYESFRLTSVATEVYFKRRLDSYNYLNMRGHEEADENPESASDYPTADELLEILSSDLDAWAKRWTEIIKDGGTMYGFEYLDDDGWEEKGYILLNDGVELHRESLLKVKAGRKKTPAQNKASRTKP